MKCNRCNNNVIVCSCLSFFDSIVKEEGIEVGINQTIFLRPIIEKCPYCNGRSEPIEEQTSRPVNLSFTSSIVWGASTGTSFFMNPYCEWCLNTGEKMGLKEWGF